MSATPTVNVQDLAKYLVLRFENEGSCITPAKLQKLLYYIQAWHLVHLNGAPLFVDEPQAWVNGPVYYDVYTKYGHYKMYDCMRASTADATADTVSEQMNAALAALTITPEQADVIESVIVAYGFMPTDKLIRMTHAEAPWAEAREGLSPTDRAKHPISHEAMQKYYGARLNKH